MKCSICNYDMQPWPGGKGYGNNAEPINSGRCCDMCNWTLVIPTRFQRMLDADHRRSAQARFSQALDFARKSNGPRE